MESGRDWRRGLYRLPRTPLRRQAADGAGQVAVLDDSAETRRAHDLADRARLSVADLERRDAGGGEQTRRPARDGAETVETVLRPSVEGAARLPSDFGGQAGDAALLT